MKTIFMIRSIVQCPECEGAGVLSGQETCTTCNGRGYQEHDEIPLEVALQALGVNLADLRAMLTNWRLLEGR